MQLAFEIAVDYLQGIVMIAFMQMRLRSQKAYSHYIDAAFVLLTGSILTAYTLFTIPVPDTCIFIVPFAYAVVTKRGRWIERIIWTMVLGVVMSLVASAAIDLYGADYEALEKSSALRTGYVISVNIVTIVILFIIGKMGNRNTAELIPRSLVFVLALLLVLQFAVAETMFFYRTGEENRDTYAIASSLCALGCTVITCILYEEMSRAAAKRHKDELRQSTLELSRRYQEDIQSVYKRMMIAQHDLQHQINTARELISGYNLSMDFGKQPDSRSSIVTGSMGADAVLMAKKDIADKNDIDFRLELCPLGKLPFDEVTFCILLTNILDNALQGTAKAENTDTYRRSVDLRLTRVRRMFCISCKNTYLTAAPKNHLFGSGSAENLAGLHGLGLESIKQIVREHNGSCSITDENNIFSVFITMPFEEI